MKNCIFSLLHVEIGVGNKIFCSCFESINERIGPISDEEVNMNNFLINLKIEQNNYHKEYDERINNNSSLLSELRLERQFI